MCVLASTGTAVICCGVTHSTFRGSQDPKIHKAGLIWEPEVQSLGSWGQLGPPRRGRAGQQVASGLVLCLVLHGAPSPLWVLLFCACGGPGLSGQPGRGWLRLPGGGMVLLAGAFQGPALLGSFSPQRPAHPGRQLTKP